MITIVHTRKIREPFIKQGIEEFKKRISPYLKMKDIIKKDLDVNLDGYTVVLDEHGKTITSKEFSKILKDNPKINFIIGPPDGFEKYPENDLVLSLSNMTFTSQFSELVLYGQIYRSVMIIHNKRYHRE